MPICKTPEQTTLLIQFVNVTPIKDDDDSVIRVGSLISCCSPYLSEISQSIRLLESKWGEAILQFKSPMPSDNIQDRESLIVR